MTTPDSSFAPARLLRGTALALALCAGACADESAPTEPDPPDPVSFDSLSVAPAAVELGRGQSQDFTVTVFDGGAPVVVPDLDVTWTTDAPATLSLMALDDRTVRAEATGAAGDATIRASAGDVTSPPARVRVLDVGVASSATTTAAAVADVRGNRMSMTLDLVVVDQNGRKVSGVRSSALSIPELEVQGGGKLLFSIESTSQRSAPGGGAFSSVLVLDQSGSMNETDPELARYAAVKQFTRELADADEVALFSFNTSVTAHTDLVRGRSSLDAIVDSLPREGAGNTALYDAGMAACEFVAAEGANPNRAVVLLTDGEDNRSRADADDLIEGCGRLSVRVLTVGFAAAELATLARMASASGGFSFYDDDVGGLLSAVRGAPALLRGAVGPDRVEVTVDAVAINLFEGGSVTSVLEVELAPGETAQAPFHVSWEPGTAGGGPLALGERGFSILPMPSSEETWTVDVDGGGVYLLEALPTGGRLDPEVVVEVDGTRRVLNQDAFVNDGELHFVEPVGSGVLRYTVRPGDSGTGGYFALATRCEAMTIQVGETLTDALEAGDCWWGSATERALADHVALELAQGQAVTLDMSSTEADPTILVFGPDGGLVAADDDGGPGMDARVSFRAAESGRYRIAATSQVSEAMGAWTLTASGTALVAGAGAMEGGVVKVEMPRRR